MVFRDYIIKLLTYMTKTKRLKYNIIVDFFQALDCPIPENAEKEFQEYYERVASLPNKPKEIDDIYPPKSVAYAIVHDDVDTFRSYFLSDKNNQTEFYNQTVVFQGNNLTYIHLAAQTCAVNCFTFLLNYYPTYDDDLLDSAVIGGNMDIIQLVLKNPNLQLKNHLRTAIIYHQNNVVGKIFKESSEEFLNIDLQFCISTMNRSSLYLIIKEMSRLECIDRRDSNLQTALIVATRLGELDIVEYLLECKADIEAKDAIGETALLTAATYGHFNVVCLLVTKGANIEAQDKYLWTPLMAACANGYEDIVRILISTGANPNARDIMGKSCYERAKPNIQMMLNISGERQP
ncbi:ankyrin repeat protein, putative [Trichomonas vaginalis G3]|uniref:Ankyrin repeat protein, putative n=1 Tax=Trichomonas vaginalis (strain ATCC PRA-98 / G3) TaxID=412133 RepID=A2E3T9_TRIV3|nr:spectrin binding [Trichomonas vaginalis G3]EAY12727.1 ankyrin repeat protein, putative [Trichomonas vaginalis G3]KAI5517511.1 spectrin binding [Trichomonas vaginalis G3]|eukprot:XP_001324950.1 ankyrin repeat protein [Trichomonas vaginalis G3]